jgi:hypothetical protein
MRGMKTRIPPNNMLGPTTHRLKRMKEATMKENVMIAVGVILAALVIGIINTGL